MFGGVPPPPSLDGGSVENLKKGWCETQTKRYDPSIRRIKAPNNPPPTIPTMAPTLIPPTDEELEEVALGAAEVVKAG